MKNKTLGKMSLLELLREINPKIVIMPILMMCFGLLACVPLFIENETTRVSIFIFTGILFIFIPTTTIPYVLKKYTGGRRRNLLLRMTITGVLILPLIIAFFVRWRYEILFVYGFLGFLYFLWDYRTQGKLYILMKRYPQSLKKSEFIQGVMETKCSRSVLWEFTRYLKNKKEKSAARKKMKDTGQRWWHLFPTTKESLTQRIFGLTRKV